LTYLYDTIGELTTVRGAESYTYSFDTSGNRNGTGYTTTTGNEMTADAAGRSMAYDHSGNLTSMTDAAGHKWTYTWDFRNRMTQVVEKDSSGTTLLNEQFTYDVFNNLIGVSVNGTQQRWTVYDGQNAYIDFDGSGTLTQRYLSNPGAVGQYFAHVAGSTVDWYLSDLTGSTREIRDGSGTQVATASYDPFGNVVSQTGTMDRFKFQGGEWDGNIGLYHFGARWNDPVDGRWVSQDPLGFAAGDSNLYRFVGNQPTDVTDRTGKEPDEGFVWPWDSNAEWGLGSAITGLFRAGQAAASGANDGLALFNQRVTLGLIPVYNREAARARRRMAGYNGNPLYVTDIAAGTGAQAALGAITTSLINAPGTASAPVNTTVWNSIRATQPVYEGTVIPRSFELTTASGRFWVHGNATEHLAEYALGAARRGLSPELVNLGSQTQLTSLQAAVNAAAQQGIQYNALMHVAGWELRFAAPRQAGQLPAIIHALLTGG
jgi:RHS repeat-associated protein